VQSSIRGLRPPLPPEENALLAFSGDALAGVSRVSWTDGGEQLLVMSIARDVRFRRVGLGVVLLRQTLDVLRTVRDEAGAGCAAFARVDHRNEPSRRMFELAGFVYLENDFEEPNLEYWVHDLL
jgi:ribosomal protein S18 acetylase RimI-like enzyme